MSFEPFRFTPEHQPDKGNPVDFELKPLDMATLHGIQIAVSRDGDATWAQYSTIFKQNVLSWTGIEREHSLKVKQDILTGEVDRHFYAWIKEIGGELYKRALLGVPERKNS